MIFNKLAVISLLSLGLVACGGGGSEQEISQEPVAPVTLEGVFIDSAVENLRYTTLSSDGVTSIDGVFTYQEGETITFSIGDITFPAVTTKAIMTPLDLFSTTDISNNSVVNTLRLLQSLDEDANPLNGIVIPELAHELSSGVEVDFSAITFDSLVSGIVASSGGLNTTLIDSLSATEHFKMSLADLGLTFTDGCAKTHEKVGQSGFFETFHHNVAGKATIIDDCTIEITQFDYDGQGPDVFFYAANDHNYTSGSAFAISDNINGTVYSNATLRLTLPSNKTLDDLNGLSVWCEDVSVNFGQVTFSP